MVTMRLLVKYRMTVTVLIANKYRSQYTMYVLRVLNTNLLHLQVENLWKEMSVLGVPNTSENIHSGITQDLGLIESGIMTLLQVSYILSKMGILIEM